MMRFFQTICATYCGWIALSGCAGSRRDTEASPHLEVDQEFPSHRYVLQSTGHSEASIDEARKRAVAGVASQWSSQIHDTVVSRMVEVGGLSGSLAWEEGRSSLDVRSELKNAQWVVTRDLPTAADRNSYDAAAALDCQRAGGELWESHRTTFPVLPDSLSRLGWAIVSLTSEVATSAKLPHFRGVQLVEWKKEIRRRLLWYDSTTATKLLVACRDATAPGKDSLVLREATYLGALNRIEEARVRWVDTISLAIALDTTQGTSQERWFLDRVRSMFVAEGIRFRDMSDAHTTVRLHLRPEIHSGSIGDLRHWFLSGTCAVKMRGQFPMVEREVAQQFLAADVSPIPIPVTGSFESVLEDVLNDVEHP